jgi:hypothetical protein
MSAELLSQNGFFLSQIQLPTRVRELVLARDWPALDTAIKTETIRGGAIFEELKRHGSFSEIEFIISIRSSLREPDEDGIWHDDGSRVLAFSLSLTLDHQGIGGGVLEVRKRDGSSPARQIPTPPYGTIIVFATGHQGFEHKINRVSASERIIIAGWCT